MRKYLLACLCATVSFSASAQLPSYQKYDLLLSSGLVSPPENTAGFIRDFQPSKAELFSGKYFRIVQFYRIPSQEEKDKLATLGLRLNDYLPEYSFLASFSSNCDLSKLSPFGIRSISENTVEMKLSPELKNAAAIPGWALKAGKRVEAIINYYADLDPSEVLGALTYNNCRLVHRNDHSKELTVQLPVSEIRNIAALPFISSMEAIGEPGRPENLVERTDHRSNTLHTDYNGGRKYNGAGVKVAMLDDGFIGPHIDYTGRALNYSTITSTSIEHGDHVSGIIMGGGNLDPKTRGMAWGANLYIYDAAPSYNGFDSIYSHYTNPGVTITSTSYSDGCNTGYTSFARTLDQQCRQMPSLVHVFSAGNNGTSNCSYGAGSGWGNITGGHKQSKNSIACANLDYSDQLNSSSSRGPAKDGRIKPDVSAVGTNVVSCTPPNSYVTYTGTSMSCPGTSGTLAQLYQAYKAINGGNNPEGGLMKSILMNTCDDIGNAGPDYKHGYGRINALHAVKVIESGNYIKAGITQGSTNTHTVTVPANTKRLKLMLYWTDYEAVANAAKALVNDLQLTVTDPSSAVYNPWVLNPAPNATTLDLPAVRSIDSLNNSEQVTIDNPPAGIYTVKVKGNKVPQGPQQYFVNFEFLMDEITVTYPMGGEPFVPGETETIRWDAFGTQSSFTLEYSLNNGGSWSTISNSVSGALRQYDWTVPSALTGQALVRVTRGSVSDVSDAGFSIIGVPQSLTVTWACANSFRLSWNAVSGATSYEVSLLGAKYMDSTGTTAKTFYVYNGLSSGNTYWVSVKAKGPTNAIGRRAVAIQKAPGTSGCNPVIATTTTQTNASCYGSTNATATASSSGGVQPYTYYWMPGGQTNQTATGLSAGTYTVLVTDNNGSPSTSNTVTITQPSNFTLTLTSSLAICLGDSATLIAGGASTYSWSPGTGLSDSTGTNVIAKPSTTTLYTVTGSDINGCTKTAAMTLTVNPLPAVPVITMNFNTLTSSSATGNQWYLNSTLISGAVNQVYTVTQNGLYTVTVTNTYGCTASSAPFNYTFTGIQQQITGGVNIYPNPGNGSFSFEFANSNPGTTHVWITDIDGRTVYKQDFNAHRAEIDVRYLAKGVYIFHLQPTEQPALHTKLVLY